MTEHGMLFSAPMVRAIFEGRKSQTRRPMKPQPWKNSVGQWLWGKNHIAFWPEISNYGPLPSLFPYGKVGDRIWLRETWCQPVMGDLLNQYLRAKVRGVEVEYAADMGIERFPLGGNFTPMLRDFRWRPSIHMPRWASRITLEISDVRVQRVQDISEEDCIAEGLPLLKTNCDGECGSTPCGISRQPFIALWESTYGPGSWERNGWVWALTFEVVA